MFFKYKYWDIYSILLQMTADRNKIKQNMYFILLESGLMCNEYCNLFYFIAQYHILSWYQ